jgi:GNAT superfamily N-acetyltransferase
VSDIELPRGYAIVPAQSIGEESLLAFAKAIWPVRPNPEKILSSWWRRAEPSCAVVAIHEATGATAGICAGLPCTWIIDGESRPAIAINNWYVVPDHMGKGLGRSLMRHYETPGRFLYAFSISDAAAANFTKLGWAGPYASFLMVHPLPVVFRFIARSKALTFREYQIGTEGLSLLLATELDHVEHARLHASAYMRRNAQDWSWHLSIAGNLDHRFRVAYREGIPVGYVVLRPRQSGKDKTGKLKTAMITDLVAVNDEPAVLRALGAEAITIAGKMGAMFVGMATTVVSHREALSKLGFLSNATSLIGRFLESRAPRFMWLPQGAASSLKPENVTLTFADSDVDFNL